MCKKKKMLKKKVTLENKMNKKFLGTKAVFNPGKVGMSSNVMET